MSIMRQWISLFEKELLQEAQHSGIAYHGTSSRFVPSILENGFKADPEQKVYGSDGPLSSYPGTYFSDSFQVAMHRGDAARETFGGTTCVLICEISHDVYADEDGIKEFIEKLVRVLEELHDFDIEKYVSENDNLEYHQEINKLIVDEFYEEYKVYPTRDFFDLFLDYITDQGMDDATSRAKINKVANQVGFSKAPGNHEAVNFRIEQNLENVKILAVVECHYKQELIDPSTVGSDFSYEILYGKLPENVKQYLDSLIR